MKRPDLWSPKLGLAEVMAIRARWGTGAVVMVELG